MTDMRESFAARVRSGPDGSIPHPDDALGPDRREAADIAHAAFAAPWRPRSEIRRRRAWASAVVHRRVRRASSCRVSRTGIAILGLRGGS